MRLRVQRVVFTLVCAGLSANTIGAPDDPCLGKYSGAHLAANLLDLSLTVGELNLLKGGEDPKLKRHLEWRLVTAAARARQHIDQGAIWDQEAIGEASVSTAPDLVMGVDRAIAYVAEHDLDRNPPVRQDKSLSKPSADLAVVKKWLSRQR
jgi:hypothetical protein